MHLAISGLEQFRQGICASVCPVPFSLITSGLFHLGLRGMRALIYSSVTIVSLSIHFVPDY